MWSKLRVLTCLVLLGVFTLAPTQSQLNARNYWGGYNSNTGCCYKQSCCCARTGPTFIVGIAAVAALILVIKNIDHKH